MPLPKLETTVPGPKSFQLARRLRKVESPGITYLSEDFPVFWERAAGCNVWDVDGNRYLDLTSAFGVSNLGHSPPAVASVVAPQLEKLVHGMGDVHPPRLKVEFLEQLVRVLPVGLDQVILSCNGSDACESALKTAQLHTGKPGVVAFREAYHGLGYGALDLTQREHFRSPFEQRLSQCTWHLDYPSEDEGLAGCLDALEAVLSTSGSQIGAIIVEPIQGRGGVVVPPPGFLRSLRDICDRWQLVLILDEIYTGLARTGDMFVCESANVIPDLLCLGKSLGGGLPLSACAGRSKVMRAWGESQGEAIHTSTFLGNPAACRAGLAMLAELQARDWPRLVRSKGEYLRSALSEIRSGRLRQVRGRGLMLGIELIDSAVAMAGELLRRGLLALPCGPQGRVLSLSPPFTISYEEMDFAVATIAELL